GMVEALAASVQVGDAGDRRDHAQHAIVFAGIAHGIEMRAQHQDGRIRLAALVAANHVAGSIVMPRHAGLAHPAGDLLMGLLLLGREEGAQQEIRAFADPAQFVEAGQHGIGEAESGHERNPEGCGRWPDHTPGPVFLQGWGWPSAGSSASNKKGGTPMTRDPEGLLQAMFDAARKAADPAVCVPPHLPRPPKGRTIVVGAGKAAASMARAVEQAWPGELEGLVLTRYGHAVPCERTRVAEGAHPVPDAAGEKAAGLILGMVQGLTENDLVLCLISGGGSALLALPAPGLTLADKQAVNQALLKSGANIAEMNCVRKHLSRIKGGRLAAAAAPARVVSLLISDVPGDDPAVIASGPTVPDPTSFADA